jgi:hypothetical protein
MKRPWKKIDSNTLPLKKTSISNPCQRTVRSLNFNTSSFLPSGRRVSLHRLKIYVQY